MAKPLVFRVIDATRGMKPKLTPADKLLLISLAVRQGGNGHSWPGIATIAEDLDFSETTVKKSIARCCATGLLEKTPGSRGRGHSNQYSVNVSNKGASRPITDADNGAQGALFDDGKRGATKHEKGRGTPMNTSGNTSEENTSPEMRLSRLLRDLIVTRHPKNRAGRADMAKWAEDVEKLIRIDKRTPDEVEEVLRWSQENEFWQGNILSTAALRRQFDTLEAQMRRGNGKRTSGDALPADSLSRELSVEEAGRLMAKVRVV